MSRHMKFGMQVDYEQAYELCAMNVKKTKSFDEMKIGGYVWPTNITQLNVDT
jgi:hypothetical protein